MPARIDPLHEQGTHHWLLTLDGIGSRSGTCTPNVDETRYDLYLRIRSEILDGEALSDGLVPPTLFFDLRDNTLMGGTMQKLRKITRETRRVIRFLATGDTVSKADRRALADYHRHQARERTAEGRGER